MDFYEIYSIFTLIVYLAFLFSILWSFWIVSKNLVLGFWFWDMDLEEYAKRAKNRDTVITSNTLENIVYFLGTIFLIWGFIVLVLLQFESTYVFLAPLKQFISAKAYYCLGFTWTRLANLSLFSRKIAYCRVKKKEND